MENWAVNALSFRNSSIFTVGLKIGVCASAVMALSGVSAHAGTLDRPFFSVKGVVIVMGGDDFSENGGAAPVAVDFNLLETASGTAANDLIGGVDGVTMNYNTGRFNAVSNGSDSGWEYQVNNATFGGNFISAGPHQTLDANDAYTAFGLDETTDVDLLGSGNRGSQFLVASNTPFDIYAQSSDLVATGAFSVLDYSNIRYRLRVRVTGGGGVWRHGVNAQNPSVGGSGVIIGNNNSYTLDDIAGTPTKVFDGGRRTARARGGILSQAVSFRSAYRLAGASMNGNNYDFSMGSGTLGATVTYTIYTP